MAMDYSKLKGRIIEKYGTQGNFAKAMELSERSISLKLNSEIDWKQKEILRAARILNIANEDINEYFFKTKVQIV